MFKKITFIHILKLACICLLIGRAIQFYFYSTPFYSFFWDESWWGSIIENWGYTWSYFSNNIINETFIKNFEALQAGVFTLTALLVPFYKKGNKITSVLLWLCWLLLIFLSFCYMKDKLFVIGQFWEYALQFLTPVLLWAFVSKPKAKNAWVLATKIAIVLTFTCHGLYAAGIYNVPGKFIDMTIEILGVNQSQAKIFLKFAGAMDFIVSALLFFPVKRIVNMALLYATLWGLATSLARIVAYVDITNFSSSLFWQQFPDMLYRLPHGLIPLALLVLFVQKKVEY